MLLLANCTAMQVPGTDAPPGRTPPPAAQAPADADPYRWFDPIIDLRALIAATYVDAPDAAAMQRAVLAAMVDALGDPSSGFIAPEADARARETVSGSFVGIGVELAIEDGMPTVISALDDSPALEAGLRPGDVIAAIDGNATSAADPSALDRMLSGPPGSEVALLVRRGDGTEDVVRVPRRTVSATSVKGLARLDDGWVHMLDPDRRIAYVRIARFTERTAAELDQVIRKLESTGLSGLVLDLRSNPGGSIDAAVGTVDRFLSEGAIVSLRGRTGMGRTWDATADPSDLLVPVVALVDRGSASASEIVAGALRDHGRAKLIGTRSYGKGSVQTIVPLPDGAGSVRLTTDRYFLPSGRSVARTAGATRWGVEPDTGYLVPMPEETSVRASQARADRESGGERARQAVGRVQWNHPPSIREHAYDAQLAAAVEALQGYLDAMEWPVVGTLSGDVGAANEELRAALEYRRRLVAELAETDASISRMRGEGAGVDDPIVAADADLIDGTVELRDRDGRTVGRWTLKDPTTIRSTLDGSGVPVPVPVDPAEPDPK
jgi:carboxyl-terminal processing protease